MSDRYKEMWEDAFHDNLEKKAEISELKAENARLKAEVERLTELNDTIALRYDATKSMLDGCAKEIEEMEAEVERLTKAGDKMAHIHRFVGFPSYTLEWEAAKNGGQP